jgi:hypothetical protein
MTRVDASTALVGATALVACVIALLTASEPSAAADPPKLPPDKVRLDVESVGKQQLLLKPGQHGLAYFPDEGISVLGRKPLTFLLVAGNVTWLMQGTSWGTAVPVRKVLEPSADGPDNGYAGIGAVHLDAKSKTVHAFYHAEDQKGYQKLEYNGVPNFMASICLAVGPLGGRQLEKRGPVLTTHLAKNPRATQPQGVADVTVSPSPDGQYLFAWYTDHSREDNHGVQICMARSPLSERGKPGTWKKWHEGDFQEPGLGGRATPVLSLRESGADAWAPNVVWVPECRRYVMVFNATVYADFGKGAKPMGGIRFTHSPDGIRWHKPTTLVTAMGVPVPGKECAIHPTLIITRASDKIVEGTLLYGYSPKWGHTAQEPPHHLASRSVRLKVATD